ncbi:Beta-amyloid-like protein [Armadillidium nasatum]|uniref:Beta-amyloid-like protein n=1 Tax=Armadillidium nasatum TaxID=96803 RepID=A0A5N5TMW1_9CRUS|nr:Beta-amyloid-like protein [Armadillidium nasatum]
MLVEGSFQSDALLVPEGCLFDHIHNQSRCWEFDQWNTTADQACQVKNLSLKAFAMLLPCGIDVFSGVEFVCCPKDFKNHGKAQTMEVEEPIALPQTDRRAESSNHGSPRSESTTPSQEVGTRDEYFSRFDPHEEHDAFRKAEQRLEERHREKVSKIMKEWSELEEHYKTLHMEDPAGAEDFKRRMTMRFQETVQSVEAENEAEKHQLTALHQQRIVAHINEMKREAMTCYTRALSATQTNLPLQTHKVQKCLQKLLRALNKDRHHTVSHFKHLLNSDYEAADRERDSTLQHLADLDRMVNQSLNMLARKPELYAKIGRLMHEYAATLRSKDITPPELTPAPPRDKDGAESIPAEDAPVSSSPNVASPSSPTNKDIPLSPSEDLPSAASVHQMDVPNVAHAQHHVFSHSQPQSYSVTREQTNPESRGVYFTLAFAGIALMGAMIVGIVVLRRRNNRHPHNQGFMEVDQAVTPEERHVTNMQVNGYENPTYKYFEEK